MSVLLAAAGEAGFGAPTTAAFWRRGWQRNMQQICAEQAATAVNGHAAAHLAAAAGKDRRFSERRE